MFNFLKQYGSREEEKSSIKWTIEKLETTGNKEFTTQILLERLGNLANPYTPLARKLQDALQWIDGIELQIPDPEDY